MCLASFKGAVVNKVIRFGVMFALGIWTAPFGLRAELVVTEIMSQSSHNGATDCDWWELTNTGPVAVNLQGYSWDDNDPIVGQNAFESIVVEPGQSAIFRDYVDTSDGAWRRDWDLADDVAVYDPDSFGGTFSALGSQDGIYVFDTAGRIVASASYVERIRGYSNAWDTAGKYLGVSLNGLYGAYRSENSDPDVASPGYAEPGAIDRPKRWIYWSDKNAVKIQRGNRDGGQIEDVLTIADGLVEPRGLAIDLPKEKMYWADGVRGTIQRADLDGTDMEGLATGLLFPTDIALDLKNRLIYFSDTGVSKIRRMRMDGSGPIEDVVNGAGQPYYLEIDLIDNRLYWGDFENTYIRRMRLDGNGMVEDFVTGLVHVRDIVVDHEDDMLYWGDRGSHSIQRTSLDGTGVIETLYGFYDGLDRPHGLALDAQDRKLYWTDTTTNAVYRGALDGSAPLQSIATGLDGPWSIGLILPKPDSDRDGDVDLADFARFASEWLTEGCDFCTGADYTNDRRVGPRDLQVFSEQWLSGPMSAAPH